MPLDISGMRRLCDATTPGVWQYDDGVTDGEGTPDAERGKSAWITATGNVLIAEPSGSGSQEACVPTMAEMDANGSFIAASHNAMPDLLDRITTVTLALQQVWYWFDDHDDRMTSAELHALLKKTLEITP